jgi:hypothetical protein
VRRESQSPEPNPIDQTHSGISVADIDRYAAAKGPRKASVNEWRSVDADAPIQRSPLAECDPHNLTSSERMPFALRCPDIELIEAHVAPDRAEASRQISSPP